MRRDLYDFRLAKCAYCFVPGLTLEGSSYLEDVNQAPVPRLVSPSSRFCSVERFSFCEMSSISSSVFWDVSECGDDTRRHFLEGLGFLSGL